MKLIRDTRLFLGLTFLFLIASGTLTLTTEKGALVLWFNEQHNAAYNLLFRNFSFLGEGIVMAAMVVVLAWRKISDGVLLLTAWLFTGLTCQMLKRLVFPNQPRPAKYFENLESFNFVPGVDVANWMSFPSGHTATAFAMFMVLAFVFRKTWVILALFICALGVGMSRIYLAQHFLEDVIAGAAIGCILTFAVIFVFQENSAIRNAAILNRPIIQKKGNAG